MRIRRENIGDISYESTYCEVDLSGVDLSNLDIRDYRSISSNGAEYKKISAPLTITVNITDLCSLNCSFCFYPFKSQGRIISDETISSIVEYVDQSSIYEVDILGGEPFHPKVIDKTIKLINKLSQTASIQRIYISTNGISIKENIKKIKEILSEKVLLSVSLQATSLDINDKICSSFTTNKVLEGIKLLEENKVDYCITTVFLKDNLEEIKNDFLDFINKLKYCSAWLWHYPTVVKNNSKILESIISPQSFFNEYTFIKDKCNKPLLTDFPFAYYPKKSLPPSTPLEEILCICPAKYQKVEIMPNGDVYPCILLNESKYLLGNINSGFATKPELIDAKTRCKNKECDYSYFCSGCPAYRNNWGKDNRCIGYK